MTVVRVLSETGRLAEEARNELAESLTKAVLDVEAGADNAGARRGVMVLFDEAPASRWAVGGRFDDTHVSSAGRLLLTVQAMEGVWSAERRRQLIERFSGAISDALKLGADRSQLGSCWILFSEIEEGSWGAFGAPISLLDLLEPLGFTPDRVAAARELLEGR